MADDRRVSVSVDSVFDAVGGVARFFGNLFHPVTRFINSVSDASWFGFAVMTMIFFMLYLARTSMRSGRPREYGEILVFIGYRGLLFCGAYFALLLLEYTILPPLVILATCIYNSVSGHEPGLFQMVSFMLSGSDARGEYLHDVAQFYGTSHSLLPLGVRAFGLVAVAIFSVWAVGRALSNLRPSNQ